MLLGCLTRGPPVYPMNEVLVPNELFEHDRAVLALAKTAKANVALRYFSIKAATGNPDARWSPFQIRMLNEESTLMAYNKSRQIGFSFMSAGDALFDGIVKGRYTVVTISYNLEEAREKVNYIKAWWESKMDDPSAIPLSSEFDESGNWRGPSPNRIQRWPDLTTSNSLEVRFSNGFRFISLPCKPPRGKQATVLLDEFAHAQHANAIYTAAFPMVTRGLGGFNRLIMGSTPIGASGKFWEVFTDAQRYPDFRRYEFGWWSLRELCEHPYEAEMFYRSNDKTEETLNYMVRKWGTERMAFIWRNVLYEDFAQEYALQFLDESESFLSWELIKGCYPASYVDLQDDQLDLENDDLSEDAEDIWESAYLYVKARGVDKAIEAIRTLAEWFAQGRLEGAVVWAYDVGRTRDAAEFSIFTVEGRNIRQRAMITLPNTKFEDQRTVAKRICYDLPVTRGLIDRGGIGMQIAEELEGTFGMAAQGIQFDAGLKNMWAIKLKMAMQHSKVTLIPDRDQEAQLHSIKRVISSDKVIKYEIEDDSMEDGTGKNRKHHADKFWAVAMAVYLGVQASQGLGEIKTSEPGKMAEAQKQISTKGYRRVLRASAAIGRISSKLGRS